MKKPKPVWMLVASDGRPFAVAVPPDRCSDAVHMGIRNVRYIPAPTTKKRKAKKR